MAAIALTAWGLNIWLVIPLVLMIGVLAGLISAVTIARFGIPSLWQRWGLVDLSRGSSSSDFENRTIVIPNKAFNAIGNGYIPDISLEDSFPEFIINPCCLALLPQF